ncbi:MAG TPA: phage antirepressor N-terminal domain-containing protein [Herpetosiphonaceae bacterium]|nr:phage antirepressor N-terminal domain-containing protein [Herpetosiphonaceae bacterium]
MAEAVEQRIVPFYGDELVAVQQPDGAIFVLFARLCENLGLKREGQVRRVQRHAVLSDGFTTLNVRTEGGVQTAQCLRIDLLPLWMSGLQAQRVKAELQEKLIRYQKEAAMVLWQAFKPQIVVEGTALAPRDDSHALQQLQHIAEMGRAITRMAEQQIELQRQQTALASRVDAAARVIRDVQGHIASVEIRLELLEDQLRPSASITDVQATEVSNRVKALAELLTSTQAGKNHYQGIFAELYRRFGVSSYKLIRYEQYGEVLAFLEDWRLAAAAASESSRTG